VYVSLRGTRSRRPGDQQPCAVTSKGLGTERREGKEKEQVVTADEIIVGIVDSPSARAALRWAAAYARSTETALRAIHVVD
jgi:K+-sensing histidine kinase KdpD